MIAGGFAVSGGRIKEIEDAVAAIREAHGIRSEFHWSGYRGGRRRAAYEELVDYAFDLVTRRHAALHIIAAPLSKRPTEDGRTELTETAVNKMYYQLCLHRLARFYGKRRAIHVRLDAGNDSQEICGMRNQLCADAYKRYDTAPNCVRSIEPVDSKNVGIVQMADVIIGGVATKCNDVVHQSAKGNLADYIQKASGRASWKTDTAYDDRFLTVWHFRAL